MRWKLVLPLYLALACAALSDFSIGAWTPTLSFPNEVRGLGSALLSLGNILLGLGCGPTLVALATEHLYGSEAAVGASIATVCAPAFVIGSLVLFNASRKPAPCRLTES